MKKKVNQLSEMMKHMYVCMYMTLEGLLQTKTDRIIAKKTTKQDYQILPYLRQKISMTIHLLTI